MKYDKSVHDRVSFRRYDTGIIVFIQVDVTLRVNHLCSLIYTSIKDTVETTPYTQQEQSRPSQDVGPIEKPPVGPDQEGEKNVTPKNPKEAMRGEAGIQCNV